MANAGSSSSSTIRELHFVKWLVNSDLNENPSDNTDEDDIDESGLKMCNEWDSDLHVPEEQYHLPRSSPVMSRKRHNTETEKTQSLFALTLKFCLFMQLVQNIKLKAAMNSVNASNSHNISIVHPQYFFIIGLSAIWAFNSSMVTLMVSLITRLSICGSNAIQSYFCDHGPVYRLACNDYNLNKSVGFVITSLFLIGPMFIIFLSYVGIFLALSKITTWESRLRALKTCVSHLLLVGIYFLPICFTYLAQLLVLLTPNGRVISTSLAYTFPAMLNPIIYVLNTTEIKNLLRKILTNRASPIGEKI
ncbi:odorant receptor, family D, subfamily 109 [Pimephales promelas]|nr:odorant receptor, family D, subfamily 109 [Pimephales promelas]